MPSKEEMLAFITLSNKYERLRDYCVPCKGSGHIHLLIEVDGLVQPRMIDCTACTGVGWTVRENYNILRDLFNVNKSFSEEEREEINQIKDNRVLLEKIFLLEKSIKNKRK